MASLVGCCSQLHGPVNRLSGESSRAICLTDGRLDPEDFAKKIAAAAGTDPETHYLIRQKRKALSRWKLPLKIEGNIIAKTRPLHTQNVIGFWKDQIEIER